MSSTTAVLGSLARSISSGALPVMPSAAVLTSSVAPSSASERSSQRSMAMRRPSLGREGEAERHGMVLGAIDQAQLGHARIHQGADDGAGGAAGAQHHHRPGVGLPAGRARLEVGEEAETVAVAAFQRAVGLLDHGVDRADAGGIGMDAVQQRHDVDLVRQGEVAAARVGRLPQERHQLLQRRAGWARPAGGRSGRRCRAASASSRAGRASATARPASRRWRRTAGRALRKASVS